MVAKGNARRFAECSEEIMLLCILGISETLLRHCSKIQQTTSMAVVMETPLKLCGESISVVRTQVHGSTTMELILGYGQFDCDQRGLKMKTWFSAFAPNPSTSGQVLSYLWKNKMWWLIPMVALLIIFGVLLVLAAASGAGPFIYTLF
jgi:hypothetical protein